MSVAAIVIGCETEVGGLVVRELLNCPELFPVVYAAAEHPIPFVEELRIPPEACRRLRPLIVRYDEIEEGLEVAMAHVRVVGFCCTAMTRNAAESFYDMHRHNVTIPHRFTACMMEMNCLRISLLSRSDNDLDHKRSMLKRHRAEMEEVCGELFGNPQLQAVLLRRGLYPSLVFAQAPLLIARRLRAKGEYYDTDYAGGRLSRLDLISQRIALRFGINSDYAMKTSDVARAMFVDVREYLLMLSDGSRATYNALNHLRFHAMEQVELETLADDEFDNVDIPPPARVQRRMLAMVMTFDYDMDMELRRGAMFGGKYDPYGTAYGPMVPAPLPQDTIREGRPPVDEVIAEGMLDTSQPHPNMLKMGGSLFPRHIALTPMELPFATRDPFAINDDEDDIPPPPPPEALDPRVAPMAYYDHPNIVMNPMLHPLVEGRMKPEMMPQITEHLTPRNVGFGEPTARYQHAMFPGVLLDPDQLPNPAMAHLGIPGAGIPGAPVPGVPFPGPPYPGAPPSVPQLPGVPNHVPGGYPAGFGGMPQGVPGGLPPPGFAGGGPQPPMPGGAPIMEGIPPGLAGGAPPGPRLGTEPEDAGSESGSHASRSSRTQSRVSWADEVGGQEDQPSVRMRSTGSRLQVAMGADGQGGSFSDDDDDQRVAAHRADERSGDIANQRDEYADLAPHETWPANPYFPQDDENDVGGDGLVLNQIEPVDLTEAGNADGHRLPYPPQQSHLFRGGRHHSGGARQTDTGVRTEGRHPADVFASETNNGVYEYGHGVGGYGMYDHLRPERRGRHGQVRPGHQVGFSEAQRLQHDGDGRVSGGDTRTRRGSRGERSISRASGRRASRLSDTDSIDNDLLGPRRGGPGGSFRATRPHNAEERRRRSISGEPRKRRETSGQSGLGGLLRLPFLRSRQGTGRDSRGLRDARSGPAVDI